MTDPSNRHCQRLRIAVPTVESRASAAPPMIGAEYRNPLVAYWR